MRASSSGVVRSFAKARVMPRKALAVSRVCARPRAGAVRLWNRGTTRVQRGRDLDRGARPHSRMTDKVKRPQRTVMKTLTTSAVLTALLATGAGAQGWKEDY